MQRIGGFHSYAKIVYLPYAMRMTISLSSYLKKGRIQAGLTRAEVAEHLEDASPWTIAQWEHGRKDSLSLPNLKKLITLYNLDGQVVLDLLLVYQFSKLEKKVKKLIEKGS